MNKNYLLKTETARQLYSEYAKDLPIVDFHNHISIADIVTDRKFENLTQLWLTPDPYKHRLMRICGVPEYYITGKADDYEKFEKFCEIFPGLAGNPVYDWSRMELREIFGIEEILCKENARKIYDRAGELLQSPEFSNNGILKRFQIAYQSPVAALTDDLSAFDGKIVAPSLRGDNLLDPDETLLSQLKVAADAPLDTYFAAIGTYLDKFQAAGCRFADHALDAGFFAGNGKAVEILVRLGAEYAKRGWTLLLHLGAKRKTSDRLSQLAGPAGGYAAAGNSFDVEAVCDLLGSMERSGGLPDTVLFPLNMSDQAALAVLQGSFSQDGVVSKVQLGPAWWWCDHALGIRNALNCVASFGVLSAFIGMTTDSRSVLSFMRHDYFRRLLCSWLDEQNTQQQWELTLPMMGDIVRKICYENAWNKISRG